MIRNLFVSIFFLITVIGCTPVLPPTQTQPAPVLPSLTVWPPTFPRTPTIVSPIATVHPVSGGVVESCVTVSSQPGDFHLTGIVPIRPFNHTAGLEISLLNLEDGTSISLMDEYVTIGDAHVSPDRETLAFNGLNRSTSKWELVLADIAGERQKVAWSDDERFYFQGWLNNHQLVVRQDSVYIIVDPYQDLQEKLNPAEFPDFDIYNDGQFFVAFDPLLKEAIYKYGDSVLLDLSTMKILARIQDGYDRIPIVAWLPSGERAAIVGTLKLEEKSSLPSDEIFIVERDGQIAQLTHLYKIFGRGFEIDHLSWSPDGTKIAFGGSISDSSDESILIVVDVPTGKMLNYCVLNILGDNSSLHISAPIWSPDGKQFLVEHLYQGGFSVLWVVDSDENVAFTFAENQSPVGWMKAP